MHLEQDRSRQSQHSGFVWKIDEEPAARWILGVLGNNQRRAVARIVAGGTEGVWTGELRQVAGYDDSTGMAGIF